ncbi:hypothetical protein [Staphylococcus massiliensis]|uniref:hypothetical protein n=1 Tax=Staphylococcus massiliensis TaxID=555791 RepID=UPI001EDFD204|nr:hypothetical protein [Staphylococcus massiliensis]MCG3400453.1 hypothetical protein [Staphylococcus massiliensis]MCG3412863.1 hypothetical protein [Staphylococcus massiliensis]
MKKLLIASSILIGGIALTTPIAHGASAQYEVKVYADADKIVKDNRHIDHDVLHDLGSEDKDEDFNVQYIDDGARSNFNKKTTFRVRKSENDDETKLQYKKRYPITDGNVDAAIQKAQADGYDAEEYEVEYGEGKQTLSVSNKSKVTLDNEGTTLPGATKSLDLLKAEAAAPFSTLLNQIKSPEVIGPVHFERHEGSIDGHDIRIENWNIQDDNVVEVSAKVSSESEAKAVQQAIIKKLDALNIHETNDQLKTNMIFENY